MNKEVHGLRRYYKKENKNNDGGIDGIDRIDGIDGIDGMLRSPVIQKAKKQNKKCHRVLTYH